MRSFQVVETTPSVTHRTAISQRRYTLQLQVEVADLESVADERPLKGVDFVIAQTVTVGEEDPRTAVDIYTGPAMRRRGKGDAIARTKASAKRRRFRQGSRQVLSSWVRGGQ